jgi:phenylpropionate dioxygenase-like ring-hydroxylating dioxygenase large terminal subunit
MNSLIQDPVLLNDWHTLGFSRDFPEGSVKQARLLGEDLVVWRTGGVVCVWKDLCIHRGAQLSRGCVKQGMLICPYHGWNYDTAGQCTKIPAHPEQKPPPRAKAQVYPAQERYGMVWTCLGTPEKEMFEFPEYDDPTYRKVACGPYPINASAPRIIENGLDVAHLSVVHEGILGDLEHAEIRDYEAEVNDDGVVALDINVWQIDADGTGKSGEVAYNFYVLRPFTEVFRKTSDGPMFAILNSVAPIDEVHSVFYSWVVMNYAHEVPEAQIREFQDKLLAQDIAVIESQRPELLPLDLQAELHLRSDRAAIAYRQWLRRLGLTFGTS